MRSSSSAEFFALGHARYTLKVFGVGLFEVWPALLAALADYYDAAPEEFATEQASWSDDEEYADIVTRKGRVIGALDRPLGQKDLAAIWGVDLMEKRAFANRIRSLFNIDGDLLPELTRDQQAAFLRDPIRYFLAADEAHSDAIMREIEARQSTRIPEAAATAPVHDTVRKPSMPVIPKAALKKKKKPKPRVEGQREMLLPITGGAGKAVEHAATPATKRKAS